MGEGFTRRVAAEVRAEQARQGLTQDQLASAAGMSQSTLSRRLTGELPFDTDELARIARALGKPVAQFLDEESFTEPEGGTRPPDTRPPSQPKAPPPPPPKPAPTQPSRGRDLSPSTT